jgi:cobalt/nickel transport system permease protein
MHLSDGFLDPTTSLITSAAAVGALGVSAWQLLRESQSDASRAASPTAGKMALVAAGVFAIQAVNFPLATGVSGHLLGGVAAAALLGPWAGMLVVAAVLAVQCFLLGDGGVSALGANILNMAVLSAVLGGPIHAMARRGASAGKQTIAAGLAAAVSLPLGAIACAAEMQLAGKASFAATAGEMLPLHFLLAIAEGAFTAAAVLAASRSLAWNNVTAATNRKGAIALIALLVVTGALVPFSSSLPDTLEAAVEHVGLVAVDPYLAPPVNDDTFAAAGNWAAASAPVLLGTLLAFGCSALLGGGLNRRTAARHS